MNGMEHKRQKPGIGREEQVQEDPGPDRKETGKPAVPGTAADARREGRESGDRERR